MKPIKIGYFCFLAFFPFVSFADEGEDIYLRGGENPAALGCVTCHTATGEGMDAAGYPNIAGKSAVYLSKQLYDFRDGDRSHPIMNGIANALNEDEIFEVTAYMESLPTPELPKITRIDNPTDIGSQLALRGDWSRNIPECVICHGPSGVGVGDAFPKLAGQSSKYIVNQLNAWKEGTRKNDQADLMGHIARAMTEDEIQAVANYFSNIGKQEK